MGTLFRKFRSARDQIKFFRLIENGVRAEIKQSWSRERVCIRRYCRQGRKTAEESEESTLSYSASHGSNECDISLESVSGSNQWNSVLVNPENDTDLSLSSESKEADLPCVPYFQPSFNFAAYVNKSPTLQELVKLGVELHKLEKRRGIPEFILKLDFDRDMKQYIRFLHDIGVEADDLGGFLTRNPLIFKEDMDDLAVRINYLESKTFSKEMIARVVTKNPYWLSFSTKRIDTRLGHFQKTFGLKGKEVRRLAVSQPRLITYSMNTIKINTFVIKEELGFNEDEMKSLLLEKPRLWMINQVALNDRFHFVHNEMKISHEQIVKNPEILFSRLFRIKQRHLFLQALGRAQYDPKLEGYVPLDKLISGTDVEFSEDIARSSVETFNIFLKIL